MANNNRREREDLVPLNKPMNRPLKEALEERKFRARIAATQNEQIPERRKRAGEFIYGLKAGGSGREHPGLAYYNKEYPYHGVAGSRGYELPGAEVKGIEVSAKRAKKKDDGGAMHGKKKVEMKSKGEKPEGYFLGGVARGLRKAVGGVAGAAGAMLGRRRSRPAPTPASPPDPAAIAKLRSRMPGGVSKLMGGFRRPAAPAPTAAPAAGAANQAAPPTQTPPAFKYGGVVPSKKASMKDREEQKWVKSVQKKAGGGKKGC